MCLGETKLKVRDMMIRKVTTAKKDTSIKEVFQILNECHVGSVVITDEKGKCRGIFTERDAIRMVATDVPLHTVLEEVMTTNIITIWEEASYAEAKRLYRNHGIRHLPVVDKQNNLVGMLSIRSVIDEFIEL